MKILSFITKKILYPACAIFSLIWIVLVAIIDVVSDTVNINLASSLMCFTMSVLLSLCNLILGYRKMPFVGRFFSHMALSIFSVSIVVALFSSAFPTQYIIKAESFYLVLLLIVVYLVIATPTLLLYHRFVLVPRERNADKERSGK